MRFLEAVFRHFWTWLYPADAALVDASVEDVAVNTWLAVLGSPVAAAVAVAVAVVAAAVAVAAVVAAAAAAAIAVAVLIEFPFAKAKASLIGIVC